MQYLHLHYLIRGCFKSVTPLVAQIQSRVIVSYKHTQLQQSIDGKMKQFLTHFLTASGMSEESKSFTTGGARR